MPADQPTPPPLQLDTEGTVEKRPLRAVPIRFSLRTLLRIMTGLAILFGLATVLGINLGPLFVQIVWLVATGWLVTGLFYARGDQRAFCIGAIIIVSSKWLGADSRFWFVMADTLTDATDTLGIPRGPVIECVYFAFILAVATCNGYLCILARRYFERESK